MLGTLLPSCSLRSKQKELVCRSLGVKTNTGARAFSLLCPRPFWSKPAAVLSHSGHFQLLPSRNISRRISLTWPFPHRHQHTRQSVDVTEQLHRFLLLNIVFWLSHHWSLALLGILVLWKIWLIWLINVYDNPIRFPWPPCWLSASSWCMPWRLLVRYWHAMVSHPTTRWETTGEKVPGAVGPSSQVSIQFPVPYFICPCIQAWPVPVILLDCRFHPNSDIVICVNVGLTHSFAGLCCLWDILIKIIYNIGLLALFQDYLALNLVRGALKFYSIVTL